MATVEEVTCETGTQVMSEKGCETVAVALGKNWYAGSVGTWENHIPGCFEGYSGVLNKGSGNGNMHFNLGGSYGEGQRGYAVCAGGIISRILYTPPIVFF